MGRRPSWIAPSGVAVLIYISRVSSPVRLGSLLSFFPFWRGRSGSPCLSLFVVACDWQVTIACAPGWAIFLFFLGEVGGWFYEHSLVSRVAVDGPL